MFGFRSNINRYETFKNCVNKLNTHDTSITCAVCNGTIEEGNFYTETHCCHTYHHVCLIDYLNTHNNCTICRYEIIPDHDTIVQIAQFRYQKFVMLCYLAYAEYVRKETKEQVSVIEIKRRKKCLSSSVS